MQHSDLFARVHILEDFLTEKMSFQEDALSPRSVQDQKSHRHPVNFLDYQRVRPQNPLQDDLLGEFLQSMFPSVEGINLRALEENIQHEAIPDEQGIQNYGQPHPEKPCDCKSDDVQPPDPFELAKQLHLMFVLLGQFAAVMYYQLDPPIRERLDRYILPELSVAGRAVLDGLLEGTAVFTRDHVARNIRLDGQLKLVLSVALKCIYQTFMQDHGINPVFDPAKYVKRREINRLIFEHYFRRQATVIDCKDRIVGVVVAGGGFQILHDFGRCCNRPAQKCFKSEHMQIFNVQGGVTEKYVRWCLGLKVGLPDNTFFETLVALMEGDAPALIAGYRQKATSMITSIWSKGPQQDQEDNDAEDSDQDGIRVPARVRAPKTPLSMLQFREALALTEARLRLMALFWQEN